MDCTEVMVLSLTSKNGFSYGFSFDPKVSWLAYWAAEACNASSTDRMSSGVSRLFFCQNFATEKSWIFGGSDWTIHSRAFDICVIVLRRRVIPRSILYIRIWWLFSAVFPARRSFLAWRLCASAFVGSRATFFTARNQELRHPNALILELVVIFPLSLTEMIHLGLTVHMGPTAFPVLSRLGPRSFGHRSFSTGTMVRRSSGCWTLFTSFGSLFLIHHVTTLFFIYIYIYKWFSDSCLASG